MTMATAIFGSSGKQLRRTLSFVASRPSVGSDVISRTKVASFAEAEEYIGQASRRYRTTATLSRPTVTDFLNQKCYQGSDRAPNH
jgi:hypothetical protein